MTYNLISSGSKGNAVIYNGNVLIDCGVSYSQIKPFKKEFQIVLLTHKHKDHLNLRTLQLLQSERPTLRIACCGWLVKELKGLVNIDVLEVGKMYNYGAFKVSPVQLYHDVSNCGFRVHFLDKNTNDYIKLFHATDTAHLEGITAKGYDLYAIEHNYDEFKVEEAKKRALITGEFTHAFGSEQTHLSWQQAQQFILDNRKDTSEVLELHKSGSFY